jgi:hypothetical protein
MIRSLRRVPGVLLADIDASSGRAEVAHDAAVPVSSLIAAARNAGVQVRIIGGMPTAPFAGRAASPRIVRSRQLLLVVAAAFIVITIVNALVPDSGEKHVFLLVLTGALWMIFIAKTLTFHR